MATFLDIGLAQHFQVIFPILLVFVLIFALLEKSKILGENKGLHSLIALSIAMMLLFVPGVVDVINVMAPWFVLFFLAIIFFMFLLLAFGTKWEAVTEYATGWATPHWFILVISIVIFIGALANVYGGAMLPFSGEDSVPLEGAEDTATDTGDFNQNVGRVIFHPKTIGLVFVLMVGSLTIRLLAARDA
ncbi:hypothetical protein HQ545_06610 [Candidatus Woesearchaeota archaeon]|nr:hypothetical protein [Candidatus Woesearchaeota archaeon]